MLDLFAGCGGMTRGFEDAGFTSVGGIEIDQSAASTYVENFGGESVICDDIIHHFRSDVPEVDVVIGGPPCQGFSNLGPRDPNDPRNRMWQHYVRVVVQSRCKIFVLENVARFAKSTEHLMLRSLAGPGGRLSEYKLWTLELNAADFGVPQRRVRTVVIGSRIGEVEAPKRTHAQDGANGLARWRTLRDVLDTERRLSYFVADTQLPTASVERFGRRTPGPFTLSQIHVGREYKDESLERYSLVAPGENRHALPDHLQYPCWRGFTTGASDVLGRLEWDQPAVTIRTEFNKPEKGRFLHPEWHAHDPSRQVNRALTHAEAALIQGFDDRHLWCGTKTSIARQIGNAVPPPLAKAVAVRVAEALHSHSGS